MVAQLTALTPAPTTRYVYTSRPARKLTAALTIGHLAHNRLRWAPRQTRALSGEGGAICLQQGNRNSSSIAAAFSRGISPKQKWGQREGGEAVPASSLGPRGGVHLSYSRGSAAAKHEERRARKVGKSWHSMQLKSPDGGLHPHPPTLGFHPPASAILTGTRSAHHSPPQLMEWMPETSGEIRAASPPDDVVVTAEGRVPACMAVRRYNEGPPGGAPRKPDCQVFFPFAGVLFHETRGPLWR